MPYWMRVFCRKPDAPTPGEVLEALSTSKLPAQLHPDADIDPEHPDWQQLALALDGDDSTLLVDRNCLRRESLAKEEVAAFLQRLGRVPRSKARDAIIGHLRDTKQVFCLQVPTDSIDPTGWAVAHAVMRFLVASCDGIVHADGEGFYRGNDLVLELA